LKFGIRWYQIQIHGYGGNRMSLGHRVVQIGLCASIFAIALTGTTGSSLPLQIVQPFTANCGTDDEIPAKDRAAADQAAMQFVKDALGPDPAMAYSLFTPDAKTNLTSEKFVAMFKQSIQPMAPFNNLHVAHTYFAKVSGGTQAQQVICGIISSPKTWVAVTAKPGPTQAHVVVEGETLNNSWVFVLWLIPTEGSWQVQYVQALPSALVGRSSGDLQDMAEAEKKKNHIFNAYILYATANQLVARGPFFQLGILPEIQQNLSALQVPRELKGRPPFTWQFGQASFKVLNVGALGVNKKIYLKIDQELESWAADKDADDKNHELISAFAKAFPEYTDVFSGLVVRAHERAGPRGFGTVTENDLTGK
jgi:hypothetical protein